MSMDRHHRFNMIQLAASLPVLLARNSVFIRNGRVLHIALNETTPYALFTSIMSALGENPITPIEDIQKVIDEWCKLLNVQELVVHLFPQQPEYKDIETFGKVKKSWVELDSNPDRALPMFVGITWSMEPMPYNHNYPA